MLEEFAWGAVEFGALEVASVGLVAAGEIDECFAFIVNNFSVRGISF